MFPKSIDVLLKDTTGTACTVIVKFASDVSDGEPDVPLTRTRHCVDAVAGTVIP